jgi:transcriptional regulator with GAF, ATPase, and Fis domain
MVVMAHMARAPIPSIRAANEHTIVGESPAIERMHDFIDRVAQSESTVLIYGESGTGKELVVRAIHEKSPRSRGPLIAVNCAAIPEHLLESELFGHVRGAFSSAVADKKGKMELAHGGTLFLDEVGELPLGLQAKLLRALQEREIEPVGGTRPIRVDVRVITATNVDLRVAVEQKTFRQDLYFRLDVVSFEMPPLRKRREDIPLLAQHFLDKVCKDLEREAPVLSAEAKDLLQHYDWPGNVRELQNMMERAIVLGSGSGVIRPSDLPFSVQTSTGREAAGGKGFRASVRRYKRQLVTEAIERAGGNMTGAAKELSVNPCYLHRLMRTLALREPRAAKTEQLETAGEITA